MTSPDVSCSSPLASARKWRPWFRAIKAGIHCPVTTAIKPLIPSSFSLFALHRIVPSRRRYPSPELELAAAEHHRFPVKEQVPAAPVCSSRLPMPVHIPWALSPFVSRRDLTRSSSPEFHRAAAARFCAVPLFRASPASARASPEFAESHRISPCPPRLRKPPGTPWCLSGRAPATAAPYPGDPAPLP